MTNEKQKCPMCGTKLKMINGRMACKDCGYYVREQGDATGTYSSAQTNSSTQPGGPAPQPTGYQPSAWRTDPTQKKGNKTGAVVATVAGVIGSIVLVVVMTFARQALSDGLSNLWDNAFPSSENTPEAPKAEPDDNNVRSSSRLNGSHIPRSEFFRQLAEVIFDKPSTEITPEEMASVTALEIDMDEHSIYFQVNYESGNPLTFDNEIGANMTLSDLSYFTGLEWISLVDDSFRKGDLDGLENLYAVFSDNSLQELAGIIPHPENITNLGVYGSSLVFDKTLEDVLSFSNLEYLTLGNCMFLEDISALSEIGSLKGLYLTKLDRLNDYSVFMSLTGLEELSIQSTQIKSIDFVSVMPNLTYFGLEDSKVTSIDALSNCPNLTSLYLMNNYDVEDYTAIGELTQLTILTVFKNTHSPIPSLDKLTALEQASFGKLWEGELSLVTAAPNISQLYLDHSYDDRLELLTDLPLEYLALVECSLDDYSSLESLSNLPLIQLDMTGSYVFGNIESVYGISTLQYLYLDRVTGVIDFDNVPVNDSLLLLSMNGFKLKSEAYGDSRLPLSDHYDLFEHFPNLQQLSLASTDIDSIEFVEKLPYLQYLDITENRVTSLKPLESLADFWRVDCGGNTILEFLSDDKYIFVNTDSEYYPY